MFYNMENKMEEKKLAICAEQITKMYKLYDKPSDRLKEALGLKKESCIRNIML